MRIGKRARGRHARIERLEVRQLLSGTGLTDAVYHGNAAYTTAGVAVPSPNPNSGLVDATLGGGTTAVASAVAYAAANTPNYTFTNTKDQFIYLGGSKDVSTTVVKTFLNNGKTPTLNSPGDAAGTASTDTADVDDTIFDAYGYFQTPIANDTGSYTIALDGDNDDDLLAVYLGGNGTPGSGTLVASETYLGNAGGLANFTLTNVPSGPNSAATASIPIEILWANSYGGAALPAVPGSSPSTGVEITDPHGTQITTFNTSPTNEPVPIAPTLTAANGSSVVLNWNATLFTSTYSVYRYVAGASPSTATSLATGLTAVTYTDSTGSGGKTYDYYVTAVNSSGSTSSNTVAAANSGMVTGPVTLLTASRTSSTAVKLSFTAPTGGSSYVITRSTTLGGTQTLLTAAGGQTGTTFTDTSAPTTGNTDYYYTVTSVDSAGSSTPATVFVGHGEGWAADYYSSDVADPQGNGNYKPLTGDYAGSILSFERIDAAITAPPSNTPPGWNAIQTNTNNDFAVRWVAYVEAPLTGYYSFGVQAADDKEQITVYDPNHLTNSSPTPVNISPAGHTMTGYGDTYTVPVLGTDGNGYQFTAGQKYLVQIDYNQGYGGLVANLYWSASSTAANQTAGTYDAMATQSVPTDDIVAPVPGFTTNDASGAVSKDQSYYALTTTVNSGVVDLQWNNVAADSYNIYRSTSQTGPYTLLTSVTAPTNGSPLTYGDSNVSNGATYYYIITGVDQAGETPVTLSTGATSGLTASATPMAVAPATPTGVVVGGINSATLGIQNHVVFAAVPFATSYVVQRAPETTPGSGVAGTFVTVPNGGAVTGTGTISFVDSDPMLLSNVNYFYQVIASDGLQSAPSTPVELKAVGTALAAEGTIEVDVNAASYAAGSTSSIVNFGNQGGVFNASGGAITVGAVADGSTASYQAFEFNGTDSASSSFNAPADISGNSSRSIEVWVNNPTIDTIEETMVSWGRRGASNGNNESFSYGSQYGVGQWGGTGYDLQWSNTAPGVTGTGAPLESAWHYMVFTYNGTYNDVYVDGQLYLQQAVAGGGLSTLAGFPVNLAAQNATTSTGFLATLNGSVDLASVRIETGALTAADVSNNFAAGVPGQTPPPPRGVVPLISGSTVSITWVPDAGAVSYNVYRATSPGGEGLTPIATGITTTNYTDNTVAAGNTYYYEITAANSGALESQRSFEAVARISLPTTVIISELQAINDTTLTDAAGDNPDYIELYNPTAATVNLAGYFLTDSKSDPTEYEIPSGSIASGSFLIVFCDGDNDVDSAGALHTNFSLGGSSGYVALVDPTGTDVLSSYSYPQQLGDGAYGIALAETVYNGTVITSYGATGYLHPTPGGPNGNIIGTGLTAEPTFNQPGGVYSTSTTFQLGISDTTAGASIYYTLDGSLPSASNGTLYTGPITINSETSLLAVAIAPGQLPSFPDVVNFIYTAQVITQDADGNPPPGWPASWGASVAHYGMNPAVVNNPLYSGEIQSDLLDLPTFSITIGLNQLFDPNTGIYSNPADYGDAYTRQASVQYLPNNGSSGFTTNIGLAIKGDASTESPDAKHGFRLEFSSTYGQSSLSYPLFGTEAGPTTFEELDLRTDENNSWQYQDPQNYVGIRDEFSDATLKALGVPAQRFQICYLYINGVFWGLYDAIDRDDASWAANSFGGSDSDYDTIKSGGTHNGFKDEADSGTMTAWDELVSYMSTLSFTSNGNYEMIQGNNPDGTPNPAYQDLLNVADLAQYMIMIDYTGNLDAPYSTLVSDPNNFYADRPIDGSTGFIFTATDSEFTLLNVNENRVNVAPSTASDLTASPAFFFQKLETNPAFKQLVADDVQKDFYNNGPLSPTATLARFESLAAEDYGPVVEESARWGDVMSLPPYAGGTLATGYTYTRDANWEPLISSIETSYLPQRSAIVVSQLAAVGLIPSLNAPSFSQYGGDVAVGYQLTITNPNSAGSIYYTLDGSDPFTLAGTLSSTAILYTKPVTLATSTEVKAAVLSGTTWSAETDETFYTPVTGVQVTELNYDPAAPAGGVYTGDEAEFIELKNFGTQAVNLDGASFTNGITYTFGSVTLAPGQVGVVVADVAAFAAIYGSTAYGNADVLGTYAASGTQFSNSGEEVTLIDGTGQTVFDFTYSPTWCPSTAGGGPSLEVIDPAANPNLNLAASWEPSPEAGGTPGVGDSIATAAPTGLTASFTGGQVVLTWSAVAGAATYNVYRGTTAGGESTTPIATGITTSAFTDSTAVAGTTYYYTVTAVDPGGVSPASNEASVVVPQTPAIPSVITQPISQIVKVGSTVTFTAAATGYPVPTVQWQISTNGGASFSPIPGATSTTYSVPVTAATLDGFEYEGVFTNSQGSAASTPATLEVTAGLITAWNFDTSYKTGKSISGKGLNLSPDPSAGNGSSSSIGMALVTGPDASSVTTDPGSSDPSSTNQAWKIVGTNGWSSAAPLVSQGAQFLDSTAGYDSITLQFDLDVTSQGEGNLAVEYTINGGTTWLLAKSLSTNGASGISVKTNTTSTNTVQGAYFSAYNAAGTEVFYNRLTVDFNGIAGVANNPSFGVRLVNASTGPDCVNLSGKPLNNTSGNWRFDEVDIEGAAGTNDTWTGAADGTNWAVPGNWSINFVPTQANNVIIGAGVGPIEITAGSFAAKTLTTESPIEVQSAATLTLSAASTLGDGLTIDVGGDLSVAPGPTVVVVNSLNVVPGGTLDVTNNELIVQNTTLAAVTGSLASAYTYGFWTGTGITSSTARADSTHLTALGVIQNNDGSGNLIYGSGTTVGNFGGYEPSLNNILVRYTYEGDANLDGKVDGGDYSLIDNGYENYLTGWSNGDFNYDGTVDGSDYTLIDNAFNNQSTPIAPASAVAASAARIGVIGVAAANPVSRTAKALTKFAVKMKPRTLPNFVPASVFQSAFLIKEFNPDDLSGDNLLRKHTGRLDVFVAA
jgi:fibronectin type 3 domain-containing protein